MREWIKQLLIKWKYKHVTIMRNVDILAPNITFGNNVKIHPNVQVFGGGSIEIGDNVGIGRDTIIYANYKIVIGENSLIAGQCYIIDSDHGIARNELIQEQPMKSKPIIIGKDCWIAAGAKILKGSYIADGTVIGAGSIVNGDTDEYGIYAGVPYKKIGERL